VPCVTLRDTTEWVETVEAGWNTLAGADPDRILASLRAPIPPYPEDGRYGPVHASERITEILLSSVPGSTG
jgi:UDP-N-acetylglucosamine 2-epimerase